VQNSIKTYTVEEAKRVLERYCVYQDRCHKEIRTKLKEMRMIPEAVDLVITHLIEHNFLNEERFAKAFARGKFNHKSWGKQRIVRELKQREISAFNIKTALLEIPDEEYMVVFDTLSRKRIKQLSLEKNKYKKRKKLADYLFYRGWESDLVYEKVREMVP